MNRFPLIAVDVGNARTKVGVFREIDDSGLPKPETSLNLDARAPRREEVEQLLRAQERACWYIGSVNRPAAGELVDWLRDGRPDDRVVMLTAGDLPLKVELPRADMVGVDRLLNAVGANRLRPSGRPALLVDVGTAITVDVVSAEGAFRGGTISPGIAMSARALHEFTDLLPLLPMEQLDAAPDPLGTSTETAMKSGLFWGAVGAIDRLARELDPQGEAQIFLGGGAGQSVGRMLERETVCLPHLTLAGIALAAEARENIDTDGDDRE